MMAILVFLRGTLPAATRSVSTRLHHTGLAVQVTWAMVLRVSPSQRDDVNLLIAFALNMLAM